MNSTETLQSLDSKKIKQLYNAQRSINALCILWILGTAVLALYAISQIVRHASQPVAILGIVGFTSLLLSLNVATLIGIYKRTVWGRVLGMIFCAFSLSAMPLGTIVGILGLIAFVRSGDLFGPGRILPDDLSSEYNRRLKKPDPLPMPQDDY